MRRLRAGFVPPLPGGAGAPPGDTTVPCQELADGWPRQPPEARSGRLPKRGRTREPKAKRAAPESAARRRKERRWRAERRPRSRKERGTMQTAAPFGAPLPVFLRGAEDYGPPRGRPNNTGDRPCALFDNRIAVVARYAPPV